MDYGYARISTDKQKLDSQLDELQKRGIDKRLIHYDIISGASKKIPEFQKLIDSLIEGDTLTVFDIDRMGRNMNEQIINIYTLSKRGIIIKAITNDLDTSTDYGKLMISVLAFFAEKELEKNHIRTRAGLAAARARGRFGGRPKGLSADATKKAQAVAALYSQGIMSISEIMKNQGIRSTSTVYTYLQSQGISIKK